MIVYTHINCTTIRMYISHVYEVNISQHSVPISKQMHTFARPPVYNNKNMKKLITIALLLGTVTSFCYSQTYDNDSRVKILIQGGAGLNGITKSENYKADFGYRFGVGVEYLLNQTWSLQTGIQVLNRRYSIDDEASVLNPVGDGKYAVSGDMIKAKKNAIYLQIPVKAAMYLPFNVNAGLQLSAGPYIAYGIGGKSNMEWTHADGEIALLNPDNPELVLGTDPPTLYTRIIDHGTFDKERGLIRFDLGLSVGVDFKYKQFFAGVGAEYGFLAIDNDFSKDYFKENINDYQYGAKVATSVSPHNYGVEMHVGFCFSAGK